MATSAVMTSLAVATVPPRTTRSYSATRFPSDATPAERAGASGRPGVK